MGFLAGLLTEKAPPWLFHEFLPGAPGPEFDHEELVPDETYVEIWLESMHIINTRKFTTRFFPALTSEVAVTHRGRAPGRYFVVTSPASLRNVGRAGAGRVLIESTCLAGPLPYRGGSIGVDLGLLRLKATDLTEPYLGLLSEVAIAAGIAFAGPAAPFVAPIVAGLTSLVRVATKDGLEIGLYRQFRKPRAGLFGIFGIPDSASNRKRLSLDQDRKVRLDGQPVKGVPYILFSIQRVPHRHDWEGLPDVGTAYKRARQALEPGGRPGDLRQLLAAFERTTRLSDDLITSDAEHIIGVVRTQFNEASQPRELSATKAQQRPLPPLWGKLQIDWRRPHDPLGRQRRT